MSLHNNEDRDRAAKANEDCPEPCSAVLKKSPQGAMTDISQNTLGRLMELHSVIDRFGTLNAKIGGKQDSPKAGIQELKEPANLIDANQLIEQLVASACERLGVEVNQLTEMV